MNDPLVWMILAVGVTGVIFGIGIGYTVASGENKESQLANAAELERLSFVVYKMAVAIGVKFDENENPC